MIAQSQALILVFFCSIKVLKVKCSIAQYWNLKVNEHALLLGKVDNARKSFGEIMKVKVEG